MSIYQLYVENQTNTLSIKRVIEYLVCVRTLEPPCNNSSKMNSFLVCLCFLYYCAEDSQ